MVIYFITFLFLFKITFSFSLDNSMLEIYTHSNIELKMYGTHEDKTNIKLLNDLITTVDLGHIQITQ